MIGEAVMLALVNRSRFRFASLALLGALTFSPACNKGGDDSGKAADKPADKKSTEPTEQQPPKVTAPSAPVANPTDSPAVAEAGEVVATVQIPTGVKMSDIAAVIDSMQPGASMMLAMQLPAALEKAAGFDLGKNAKLDAAMSFVIVDPASHPEPLALLVEAKDAAALSEAAKAAGHGVEQRGDTLLIGPADVVSAAKDFAFTNLTKYPDHTEIIVYPQRLLKSYADAIDSGIAEVGTLLAAQGGENMTQMLQSYFKGLVSVAGQTERVVVSVTSTPASADLIMRFYPVANSQLASFIGAQAPTDYALLGKLPSGGGMMLMAGDFRAGPVRDALVEWSAGIMGPMYGGMSADEWNTMLKPWLDNLDGRFAMSMNMTLDPSKGAQMQMQGLMGVSDSVALLAGWREMLSKMSSGPAVEMMGMKISSKHETKVLEHDGVEVDLYSSTIDTSALPPDQAAAIEKAGTGNTSMHLAAFDNYAVMSTADADGQAVRAVIDAARGKGTNLELSPTLTSVIDASKQRGDSWLMYFDLAAVAANAPTPPPQLPFKGMSMAAGKYETGLGVRVALYK